jgi:hypothetical protein
MKSLVLAALSLAALAAPAFATSGPGCLHVVNVARNDALNMRARPTANSRIVDILVPGRHGIIHLDAKCRPLDIPWASRWCPVSHYDGDRVTKGWVKARYVRDIDCP